VTAHAPPVLRPDLDATQTRRLVSLVELQERFGFSERWWRYRIAEGMPTRKWVGGLRFNPDEVEAWLDSGSNSG